MMRKTKKGAVRQHADCMAMRVIVITVMAQEVVFEVRYVQFYAVSSLSPCKKVKHVFVARLSETF